MLEIVFSPYHILPQLTLNIELGFSIAWRLVKYNLYNRLHPLKCTIQWVLIYSPTCAIITTV